MSPTVFVVDVWGERYTTPMMEHGWGRLWSKDFVQPPSYPGEPIGLDNGAFRQWKNGTKFDDALFLRRVDRCWDDDITLRMAVLPDVVAGGRKSLELSATWFHYRPIPKSWPWFLVVQDGMTPEMVIDYHFLPDIAGLFLGGTDTFKTTAQMWLDFARSHNLMFHYGRCNTIRRVEAALELGVDSVDTFALHPMKWVLPKVAMMRSLLLGEHEPHPNLFGGMFNA